MLDIHASTCRAPFPVVLNIKGTHKKEHVCIFTPNHPLINEELWLGVGETDPRPEN